jgi:hypothetical protein
MKKMLFAFALIIISSGVFAQDSTKTKKCLVMENGKMMSMKGGKEMVMTQNMMLKNGATVMPDGTVKMKDGSSMMLKEGQYVDMNGKMGMMSDMKMEKMKKDSM